MTSAVHQHVCGCGDYFLCTQGDRCTVTEPWQCDNCEERERRYYTEQQQEDYLKARGLLTESREAKEPF